MRHILVVEDSAATRALVRAILEDSETRAAVGELAVVEAESGFDAMRLLPRHKIELVVTDINMPDVNGLELIHFIRKAPQYADLPVVIISTQSTERDVERAKKLGADAYVAKPFSADELRATCVRLLRAPRGASGHG